MIIFVTSNVFSVTVRPLLLQIEIEFYSQSNLATELHLFPIIDSCPSFLGYAGTWSGGKSVLVGKSPLPSPCLINMGFSQDGSKQLSSLVVLL